MEEKEHRQDKRDSGTLEKHICYKWVLKEMLLNVLRTVRHKTKDTWFLNDLRCNFVSTFNSCQ